MHNVFRRLPRLVHHRNRNRKLINKTENRIWLAQEIVFNGIVNDGSWQNYPDTQHTHLEEAGKNSFFVGTENIDRKDGKFTQQCVTSTTHYHLLQLLHQP